jgi:hypothetical protein
VVHCMPSCVWRCVCVVCVCEGAGEGGGVCWVHLVLAGSHTFASMLILASQPHKGLPPNLNI